MESGRQECYCKNRHVSKCEVGWRIFSVVTAILSIVAIALSLTSFIQSKDAVATESISQRASLQPSIATPMQQSYMEEKVRNFSYPYHKNSMCSQT